MPDLLPKQFAFSHGLCIFLHNELVDLMKLLLEGNFLSVPVQGKGRPPLPTRLDGERLFCWLEDNDYGDVVVQMYVRSVFPAIVSDMCNFLLEALNCSRKGKLTVAYALLRKPLREDLFYLERLLADPADFIGGFHGEPIVELAIERFLRTPGRLQSVIAAAAARLPASEMYAADQLFSLRYDRAAPEGFAGLWDKALHLITLNQSIRTEDQNLNFIFSDAESHGVQWTHLYTRLPLLLSYAVDVSLALAIGLLDLPVPQLKEMQAHRQIALALWLDDCAKLKTGRASSHTCHAMVRSGVLRCPECGCLSIGKRSLKKLYFHHPITCSGCQTSLTLLQLITRAV
jgi:hypothetical protein